MRYIHMAVLCVAVLLAGCATGPRYTKADYAEASRYCFDQAELDKKAKKRDWFSRWLACRYVRVAPIEMSAFPSKEAEIKRMYENLFVLARGVDAGWTRVEKVYAEWDRMLKEIGIGPCTVKSVDRNGAEHCFLH